MYKKIFLKTTIISAICFSVLLFLAGKTIQAQLPENHNGLPETDIPKPPTGVQFNDPVFNSVIMRITDNKSMKTAGLKPSGIFPQYSKRQAWNCNETFLILCSGDGNTFLFDGSTYKFIKVLEGVAGDDIFWHPLRPALLYYVIENTLYSYNVNSGNKKALHVFKGYSFADTHGEGNLSGDGRYYALAGRTYNSTSGEVKYKDLLVYDILNDKIISNLALPEKIENFDWISVSPEGKYVVVDYADNIDRRFHGLEVYDINFKFIWQKPIGAGHSDIGIDEDGNEVLVMDVYDPDANITYIKKFKLSDGGETTLLEVSPFFDLHISCRNTKQKGWCYISTFDYVERLSHSASSWLPFEDEIFALKLDGSGEVKRIAHHHSRRYSHLAADSDNSIYWAEPHATVSASGQRILFGSNWNKDINLDSSVDTYVIDLKK